MADSLAAVPPAGAAQPAHESPVICLTERRIASGGTAYTFAEFVMHYGWEKGFANWQHSECGDRVEQHASTLAASQLVKYVLCERRVSGPPKTDNVHQSLRSCCCEDFGFGFGFGFCCR